METSRSCVCVRDGLFGGMLESVLESRDDDEIQIHLFGSNIHEDNREFTVGLQGCHFSE